MSIRYTVVAIEEAENQLIALWMAAPAGQRAAITDASDRLDWELRFDADQKGVPAPATGHPERHALDHPPLRAYFEVSEPDRLVRILGFDNLPPSP
jgi:hypothetical protein